MKNKQKCKKMQKKTNNAKMNKVKKRMLIVWTCYELKKAYMQL
jgi:hypothetical protein